MPLSWERFTEIEEEANFGACAEHAAKFGFGNEFDCMDYMECHDIKGCEDMPCRPGCPLLKGGKDESI